MMQEIFLTDAVGKTIRGSAYSITCSQAVIAFTDGTFATLCAVYGAGDGPPLIEDSRLNLFGFGDDALQALGIVTTEELEALRHTREATYRQTQETRERALLAKLMDKYAPVPE